MDVVVTVVSAEKLDVCVQCCMENVCVFSSCVRISPAVLPLAPDGHHVAVGEVPVHTPCSVDAECLEQ